MAPSVQERAIDSQAEALAILRAHVEDSLARSGLRRIESAGTTFNPATMTAVEAIIRPDLQNGPADRIKTAPGRTGSPPVRLARRSTQLLTPPSRCDETPDFDDFP